MLIGLAGSNRVQREIYGNAVDPGEGLASTVESIQRPVGPHERFLRHILRLRGTPQQMQGQSIHAPLVLADERSESFSVSAAGSLDEFAISPLRH